jgi:hypothetical protein
MRSTRFLLSLILPVFLLSCQGPASVEKLNEELMEVDRAFSELSRNEGMNSAFAAYCHPEGVLLRPDSYPIEGKEAITTLLRQSSDSTIQLTWDPLFALAAESGELGYTYGTYRLTVNGTNEVQQGTYLTIWKKGETGWKYLLDTGNEGLGE